jgi:hypothetical protein
MIWPRREIFFYKNNRNKKLSHLYEEEGIYNPEGKKRFLERKLKEFSRLQKYLKDHGGSNVLNRPLYLTPDEKTRIGEKTKKVGLAAGLIELEEIFLEIYLEYKKNPNISNESIRKTLRRKLRIH